MKQNIVFQIGFPTHLSTRVTIAQFYLGNRINTGESININKKTKLMKENIWKKDPKELISPTEFMN